MVTRRRIVVDSSVIIKWFKRGEEFEEEALRFRDDVLSETIRPIISEWVYLEVVRGLIKAGFPRGKVIQAYNTLKEMSDLVFIEVLPVSSLLDEAKNLEIELKLYASDAVNLAPAITLSLNMLSEDKHLHRKSVREFVEKRGLRIYRLKDLYPSVGIG